MVSLAHSNRKLANETDIAPHARPRGQSRDALLNAASALMRERDTIEVSMIDIAASAGVNHAMVKYHFGSKEGLLFALLERDMADALDGLERLVQHEGMTPTQKMRAHLSGIVDYYYRLPYLNRLVQGLMRDCGPERQRHIASEIIGRIADAQHSILMAGVESGEFRKVDPKLFYFTTVAASDGLYSNRFTLQIVFGGLPQVNDSLHARNREHTIDMFMAGLLATPQEDR